MKQEKQYDQVGNIRIKQTKPKKKNKKTGETSLIVKIFVWFMFLAMLASSFGVLIYYFIATISN